MSKKKDKYKLGKNGRKLKRYIEKIKEKDDDK